MKERHMFLIFFIMVFVFTHMLIYSFSMNPVDPNSMSRDGSNASSPVFLNMTATGTFKIPLVAPEFPEDGMIWFEAQ